MAWAWVLRWKRDFEVEGDTPANRISLARLMGGVILAIVLCFIKIVTIFYPVISDVYWRWPVFVICLMLVLTEVKSLDLINLTAE